MEVDGGSARAAGARPRPRDGAGRRAHVQRHGRRRAAQRGHADLHRLHRRHGRRIAGCPHSDQSDEGHAQPGRRRHQHRPVGRLHAQRRAVGRRLVHVPRRLARQRLRRERRGRAAPDGRPAHRRRHAAGVREPLAERAAGHGDQPPAGLRVGRRPDRQLLDLELARPRHADHDEPQLGARRLHLHRRLLRGGLLRLPRDEHVRRRELPVARGDLRPDGPESATGADRTDRTDRARPARPDRPGRLARPARPADRRSSPARPERRAPPERPAPRARPGRTARTVRW